MNALNFDRRSVTGTLSSRALLISLRISAWSGRRLDKDVAQEVNSQHGAAADASRVNKQLLPPKALEPVQKVISETRTGFINRSLPWMTDGTRIMGSEAFIQTAQWAQEQRSKFETEVDRFLLAYPNYVQDAATRLGTMFKPEDYPGTEILRSKFGMEFNTMPVPSGDDWRVDLDADVVNQLRSELERSMTAATTDAIKAVYGRVADVTQRMAERLRAYKPGNGITKAEGVFRDSLVENVRDLVSVLPSLNITDDPSLRRLGDELVELCRFDADTLRNDPEVRRNVAESAQDILDRASGFLA